MENGITRKITMIVLSVFALIILALSSRLLENNHAGYMQVKQAATSGEMSVRLTPGMYAQMFGTITTYKISDVYDFNEKETQISVRFNDASTATVSGQIKYRLPITEAGLIKIHRDFRSYEAIHDQMIRQVVSAALKQSATYFRAEEVYSTRRADFVDLVNSQIRDGIYATIYSEEQVKDELGDLKMIRKVAMRLDEGGKPIINEESAFHIYGIDLIQFVINDIDFDEKTNGLIMKRKEAEQEMVVAKANAERAKQDAITAQEQGKANIALAEASALVEKKKAVVEAEKETEIAQQKALQAEQFKKAVIAQGEAEAAATKLKVAAGLSPLEAAQIQMQTAIGVADKLSQIKLPGVMVMGSGGPGGQINPFDAVGLEAFMRMSKNFSVNELAK